MPSAAPPDALAPLRAHPERAAILLDIDGTLAPIVRQAEEARVPERTRALLAEVTRRYGLVACVTGRRASEARRMVAIGSIHYIGTHGTELLRAGWAEPVLDEAVAEWTDRMRAFRESADTPELRRLRVRIEDKSAIIAFHWRQAPDEDAARERLEGLADEAGAAGLRTHWGRKVLEVRPPVRMDKGVGVAALLRDATVDSAVYVGDDLTDLDAFRALVELRDEGRLSHAVRVGVISDEGPPGISDEADLTVDGTDGVLDLLGTLVGG